MDFDSVQTLMALPAERQVEYKRYIRAYQLIRSDAYAGRTTEAEFAAALTDLLEADADVAWLLEMQAVDPHVEGMSEEQRRSYDTGMLSLPAGQRNRSVDTSDGLDAALERAQEDRRQAENRINALGVMQALDAIDAEAGLSDPAQP